MSSDDDSEPYGAVKRPRKRQRLSKGDDEVDRDSSVSHSGSSDSDSSSQSDASGSAAREWNDEDEDAGPDADDAGTNNCVYVIIHRCARANADEKHSYCGMNELEDPSEIYEEYLTCRICGDNGQS